MTKIYCDNCGKMCNIKHYTVDLPTDENTGMVSSHYIKIKYCDLCIECFNKLKKWIDEE